MNHTPGPWELTKDGISVQAYPPGDVIRICLAPDHMFHGPDSPRWRANARLIAAAPDLLKALQEIADFTPTRTGGDPVYQIATHAKRVACDAIEALHKEPEKPS